MRLEARKYLTDIQAATERIARFIEGKRFRALPRIRPKWLRSSRITPSKRAGQTGVVRYTHERR